MCDLSEEASDAGKDRSKMKFIGWNGQTVNSIRIEKDSVADITNQGQGAKNKKWIMN